MKRFAIDYRVTSHKLGCYFFNWERKVSRNNQFSVEYFCPTIDQLLKTPVCQLSVMFIFK